MINKNPTWIIGMKMHELEEIVIQYCLRHFEGDKKATAKALGISIRKIDYKVKEYNEKRQHENSATR